MLIGAAIIFGANYLNLWHETRKRVIFARTQKVCPPATPNFPVHP